MWNALLRMLGLAKTEYHHVVAGLTDMANDLVTLAENKRAQAERLAQEIKDRAVLKDAAEAAAIKAGVTATKIAALVS